MKRGDKVARPNPPFDKQTGTVKSVGLDGYINVKLDDGGHVRWSPKEVTS